jgi:hypothetical protein
MDTVAQFFRMSWMPCFLVAASGQECGFRELGNSISNGAKSWDVSLENLYTMTSIDILPQL